MIVTCIAAPPPTSPVYGRLAGEVTVGKDYVVYAIQPHAGLESCFAICDDEWGPEGLWYPVLLPAQMFEVVDGTIPGSWIVGRHPGMPEAGLEAIIVIGFPEWVSDSAFHERLINGEGTALETFYAAKSLVDAE